MTYDEGLAERLRETLRSERGISARNRQCVRGSAGYRERCGPVGLGTAGPSVRAIASSEEAQMRPRRIHGHGSWRGGLRIALRGVRGIFAADRGVLP